MFTDPQTVTINSVAQTLPRTSFGADKGAFKKDDGTVSLSVSHQYGKRTRRQVRLEHSKISSDVFLPATSVRQAMSVYMVIDTPTTGYTVAEAKQIVDGLLAYLTASSGASVTKILGGES